MVESNSEKLCLVCSSASQFYSVGECNHSEICMYCCMKSRTIYNDIKCPLCNNKNTDVVMFATNQIIPSYNEINPEDCYKDDNFNENGIYYLDIAAKESAMQLTNFKCPIANCKEEVFNTFSNLSYHLKRAHKRYYCEVCVKEGKRFMSEATLFSYDELQNHLRNGEIDQDNVVIAPIHCECKVCIFKN